MAIVAFNRDVNLADDVEEEEEGDGEVEKKTLETDGCSSDYRQHSNLKPNRNRNPNPRRVSS